MTPALDCWLDPDTEFFSCQPLFVVNLQWLNDIENDPAYRSWPSGVQELLRATFPGVIRQIRRNFFNLVSLPAHSDQGKTTSAPGGFFPLSSKCIHNDAVYYIKILRISLNIKISSEQIRNRNVFVCQVLFLDPVQEETVELVKLAELFYKHKIPLRLVTLRQPVGQHLAFLILIRSASLIFTTKLNAPVCLVPCRIGFVFVVNGEEEIDGSSDAGVAFYRLLNYIGEEYDLSQALMSTLSVSVSHT